MTDLYEWLNRNRRELEKLNTLINNDSWTLADDKLKEIINENDYNNLIYPLKFVAKDYLQAKIGMMGNDTKHKDLEISIFNELTKCDNLQRLFKIFYLISIIRK